jgi:hypothetical protein
VGRCRVAARKKGNVLVSIRRIEGKGSRRKAEHEKGDDDGRSQRFRKAFRRHHPYDLEDLPEEVKRSR